MNIEYFELPPSDEFPSLGLIKKGQSPAFYSFFLMSSLTVFYSFFSFVFFSYCHFFFFSFVFFLFVCFSFSVCLLSIFFNRWKAKFSENVKHYQTLLLNSCFPPLSFFSHFCKKMLGSLQIFCFKILKSVGQNDFKNIEISLLTFIF